MKRLTLTSHGLQKNRWCVQRHCSNKSTKCNRVKEWSLNAFFASLSVLSLSLFQQFSLAWNTMWLYKDLAALTPNSSSVFTCITAVASVTAPHVGKIEKLSCAPHLWQGICINPPNEYLILCGTLLQHKSKDQHSK